MQPAVARRLTGEGVGAVVFHAVGSMLGEEVVVSTGALVTAVTGAAVGRTVDAAGVGAGVAAEEVALAVGAEVGVVVVTAGLAVPVSSPPAVAGISQT